MANPIIDTDVANSAPGVPQPIVMDGPSLPPSFPIAPAGTWLPPPTVGNPVGVPTFPPTGTDTAPVAIPATAPFATPVVPPGTGDPGIPQPQIAAGPSLPPAFPLYTSPGPVQPIVLTGQMNIGNGSTVPMTPGTQPILVSDVATIPQLPWNPGGDEPEIVEPPPEDELATRSPYTGIHQRVAEELASARGIRKTPPTPERDDWKPQPPSKPRKKGR